MKTSIVKIFVLLPLFIATAVFGQNVNMTNGSSTQCSGTFFDSGGNGGQYGNSQTLVYTFCPSTPGADMTFNFTSFSVENGYDFLQIFDGNSVAAPSLGTYSGTVSPGFVQASPSNPTGCITFRFTSDGSVTQAGWAATISCTTPCVPPTATIVSSSPAPVGGIIRVCQGATVNFTGSITGGPGGADTYAWNFGNGTTSTAANPTATFPTAGSFQVSLNGTEGGCPNTNSATVIVQVSTTPTITTAVAPNPICLGQSANLTANVTMTPFVPNCTPPVSGTTFLPDGSGVSYSTGINVNCYNAAQTVTSVANFSNICLNMEHSYLGDLQITLICPNGQSMILKSYANGGNGTHLGGPYDGVNDATYGPGVGLTYCFTPGAPTLLTAGPTQASPGPTAGNTIVPGNYMPTQPFTNLIGCPLNGTWTIQVTDNLALDNGYIFNWDVNFTVPPATGSFTPTIASQGWNAATGLTSTGVTTATITPTAAGTPCYTYSVTDNFGCTYTQNQCITVNPNTPVNAGPDVTICQGASTTLTASNAATYSWSNGLGTGNPKVVSPTTTTTYTVTGTSAAGCITTDQVTVTVVPPPTTTVSPNVAICNGASTTLTAGGATTYSWSPATGLSATTGSTVTANPTTTQTYTVTGTTAGCTSTATVTVTVNPLPTVNGGPDQTVCQGTNVTLAATGASTYTWTGGVTQGVPFAPPIGTTTYTVTGTSAAGCTNTDQVNVTVNPTPIINAGPDVTVCAGVSTTLSATGGTTYSWNTGATTASITVTPAVTTTYTVTGTTAGCTASDAVTVTVAGSAAINAGPDVTICIGQSTTLSATGGATYSWNNGLGVGNGFTVSPSTTTTYTVTGTDAGGCVGTDAMTVTVNPLPTINAGPDQAVCAGTAVTLTATGGTSYTWNNGVTQGVAFTPAATTTYTVTGTSAAGCTNTDQVLVTVNPLPIVSAGPDFSVCTGGSATLNGSGAAIYTWNNGVTNGVAFTPASTQTYTVTGTSVAGCTNTDQVVVSVLTNAPVNAGPDVAICSGQSTTLTATGAVTYNWDQGLGTGNGFTVSPTGTTTYTVVGTDGNGCIGTDAITVTVNPLPTTNAGADQTVCQGSSVTLTATGAATYTWDNGVNNGVAFTPAVGTVTYTVTGTSAAGCITTDQVVVNVNPLPTTNAGADQTVCAGTSVTLTATGAASYSWTGGVNQGVPFIPLATTTYTVTGTSAAGCTTTDAVTVTVNPLPTTNAGVDQSVCDGSAITLTATGAATYSWDNGVSNGIAFTPAVGTVTYTVTGTSAAGCITTDQVLVTVNPNPAPVIQGPAQYCAGFSSTLSTSVPYTTYNWSTGAATPTVNVTIANNPITVTVTNGFGCQATSASFTVTENAVITANFTETICQGASVLIHGISQSIAGTYSATYTTASGCDSVSNVTLIVNPLPAVNAGVDQAVCTGTSTTLTATGAANYTWDNGVTNGVPFTQAIGTTTYTVTGTDINGCVNTDQVNITVNPLPIIGAGIDQAICVGASATLNGSGGSTYTWNNGITNGVAFTPAVTTTFTITGTDANGCINTDQVDIVVNPLPAVNAGLDITTCAGGTVTLSGSGATVYSWNNGITNGVAFTPAATTTYTVTGTDANGCINSDQVVVTVAGLPAVSAGLDQTVCEGTSVTLNGSGAATYNWDNGVTNGIAFTPAVGTITYTLTGTDGGGCINTDQVTVTVNPLPIVDAGVDQTICIGTGVTLAGSGASTYTWNNGVVNNTPFNPVLTNTYTVTGTDANGCIDTDQLTVTVNPLPVVDAGLDQTVCSGTAVTLSGSGASIYTWDNGVTNAVSFVPAVGTVVYTATGTDVNGCVDTDQVTVTVNPLPVVDAGQDLNICVGTSITLSGSGAATYTWDNGVTNGVSFAPSVGTVTYTVTGTDGNGCIDSDQVTVTVNPSPVVNAGNDQVICIGGSVTLTATGAATYSWDNGVIQGTAFSPSVGTVTYTVTGTSAAGCISNDQVVVTVNPLPNVFAGNNLVICEGQTVLLTGSGAVNYTWNNGVLNGVAFSPNVGTLTYTVTGTDANGCVNTDQVDVTVNPNPVVSFVPGATSGCTPFTTTLTNTTPDSQNCIWTLSNGTVLVGCGTVPVTFSQGGCYDVTLTTTATNGCTSNFTANDLICVEDYPNAAFAPDETVLSTLDTEVYFENLTTGASQYNWSFGFDDEVSTVENPIVSFPSEEEGSYEVVLIASSPLGCQDTASMIIQVYEELLFYVPNTFTPDLDNYNPIFQPVFTSGFDPQDYVLYIYNRWGELIFESRNAEIGWDGTYGSNGEIEMCQDGTYTWKIEFKVSRWDERRLAVGHVNLLR